MNPSKIEQSAVWRLLKVIYIGLYLIVVSFAVLINWEERPHSVKKIDEVVMNCENGKQYPFRPDTPSYFYSLEGVKFTPWQRIVAVQTCAGEWDSINSMPDESANTKGEEVDALVAKGYEPDWNFTIDYAYENKGGWQQAIKNFAILFIISFAIIEAVKSALLYILGISIWRGGLGYLRYVCSR